MDSFHTFLFQCYRHFDNFVGRYLQVSKSLKLDFLEIGHFILNAVEEKQILINGRNQDKGLLLNQYTEELSKFVDSFEIHVLLEYAMCLCFFSANDELSLELLRSNHNLFVRYLIGKDFKEGVGFCFAVPYASRVLLQYLVSIGMDLTMTIDNSFIMTSTLYGNIQAFDFFVEKALKLNHRNSNGDTAILFAAMNGDTKMIEKLIMCGEDLLVVNNHGFNVFICAAFHNQHEAVRVLAKHIQEKYGQKKKKEMIDHKDKDGETPLHIGARLGFASTVKALLEQDAEMNIVNKTLHTPLDMAKKAIAAMKKDPQYLSNQNNLQIQKKLTHFRTELKNLVYVQQLLPQDFRDNVLFSKPFFENQICSTDPFNQVISLFKEHFEIREALISKQLEDLLINEKKSKSLSAKKKPKKNNSNNSNNNNSNSDGRKKTSTTTQIIQQVSEKINDQSNIEKINENLLNINNDKLKINNDKLKSNYNNNEKANKNSNNNKKSNSKTKNESNDKDKQSKNNIPEIKKEIKVEQKKEQEKESEKEIKVEQKKEQEKEKIKAKQEKESKVELSPDLAHSNNSINSYETDEIEDEEFIITNEPSLNVSNGETPTIQSQQKDYKKEYEALAHLYLEQSSKFKIFVSRLTEIETYFAEFNNSLYSKNMKAEALGLGIAEILGVGLTDLSLSQLTELENIHKESIKEIETLKQNYTSNLQQ